MICNFTSLLSVFQSYHDDGWVIMKGCEKQNPSTIEKIPPQAGLGLLDQQASANTLIYRGLLCQSGGSQKVGRVASHERVYIHLLYCAYVLGHIKTINFPFVTNGTKIILGISLKGRFLEFQMYRNANLSSKLLESIFHKELSNFSKKCKFKSIRLAVLQGIP